MERAATSPHRETQKKKQSPTGWLSSVLTSTQVSTFEASGTFGTVHTRTSAEPHCKEKELRRNHVSFSTAPATPVRDTVPRPSPVAMPPSLAPMSTLAPSYRPKTTHKPSSQTPVPSKSTASTPTVLKLINHSNSYNIKTLQSPQCCSHPIQPRQFSCAY